MNDGSKSASVFTRYIADSLKEERREIIPPTNLKLLPIGRLLNWLLNYWTKPTISTWQIYTYGPRPRDPKGAIGMAEILVQRGWLTPIHTHRHDRKVWLVNRDAEQIAAVRKAPTPNRRKGHNTKISARIMDKII
jgi:hypothetical protein